MDRLEPRREVNQRLSPCENCPAQQSELKSTSWIARYDALGVESKVRGPPKPSIHRVFTLTALRVAMIMVSLPRWSTRNSAGKRNGPAIAAAGR